MELITMNIRIECVQLQILSIITNVVTLPFDRVFPVSRLGVSIIVGQIRACEFLKSILIMEYLITTVIILNN
jgi:hypothetical protein